MDASHDYLFFVLACDEPLAAPARYCLADADTVTLTRAGDGRSTAASTDAATRSLLIRLPDPTVATPHADLVRIPRGWMLIDRGSRQGTRHNGTPVVQCPLVDGDLIEAGSSFLLFRSALPAGDDRPGDRPGAAPLGPPTLLPALERDLGRLAAVAATHTAVLLRGPAGAGKEELARAVHLASRRPGPLVTLRCHAHAGPLALPELLGHTRGAFTGAIEGSPGLLRAADRGTLLLDDVADLAPAAQSALLRVLCDQEVWPVGATAPARVQLRLVGATRHNLDQLVDDDRFSRELYQRLAAHTLTLPPLHRRREDLGLLVARLLRHHAPDGGRRARLTRDAARALLRWPWPGNLRELEHCLLAALARAGAEPIGLGHLSAALAPYAAPAAGTPAALTAAREADRRARLLALLAENEGNLSAVARGIGASRAQVHRYLDKYDIDLRQYRRIRSKKK